MNLSFERAAAADVEALVKAQISAFHHDAVIYPGVEIGGPPGYDSVETTLKRIEESEAYTIVYEGQTVVGKSEFYKIVYEGQIIGGIVVVDMGEGHFHLDVINIDPAYQSRGIGTRAMQFIERTYPATKWTLDTPAYATRNHHFYEKFGYVKVGEANYDGFILLAYEKRL